MARRWPWHGEFLSGDRESEELMFQDAFSRKQFCWSEQGKDGTGVRDSPVHRRLLMVRST